MFSILKIPENRFFNFFRKEKKIYGLKDGSFGERQALIPKVPSCPENFVNLELRKRCNNRAIRFLHPDLIKRAEEYRKEKKYGMEVEILKKIQTKTISIFRSYKTHKIEKEGAFWKIITEEENLRYRKLIEDYNNKKIECGEVFTIAARNILNNDFMKFWKNIRKAILENKVPEENIPGEKVSINKIKKWFKNSKNLKIIKGVTQLSFSGEDIHVMPEEIGFFENLKKLNLGKNNIKYLPRTIKNCKNLENVHLEENLFEVFPLVIIENCKKLKTFNLESNKIKEMPLSKMLKNCEKLEFFNISRNKIDKEKYKDRKIPIEEYYF